MRVFRLFCFHLGLFFACLGPKFNLSRDDGIFLLNLSCHMAPVCNFQSESQLALIISNNVFYSRNTKIFEPLFSFCF